MLRIESAINIPVAHAGKCKLSRILSSKTTSANMIATMVSGEINALPSTQTILGFVTAQTSFGIQSTPQSCGRPTRPLPLE
jgi:hypothetical protein